MSRQLIMNFSEEPFIETPPTCPEKNPSRNCKGNFSLIVRFMVANPETHDVSCCETEISFNGQITVGEASQFAQDNFSGTLDVPRFFCRAVFHQHSFLEAPLTYFNDPKMFGTLDQRIMDVFESGGIMWIANDPRCFEMELYSELRRNRLLILGMFIILAITVVTPELLEFLKTLLLLKYGQVVIYRALGVS